MLQLLHALSLHYHAYNAHIVPDTAFIKDHKTHVTCVSNQLMTIAWKVVTIHAVEEYTICQQVLVNMKLILGQVKLECSQVTYSLCIFIMHFT